MALIQCPECNQMISDKAEKCPKCGFPIKTGGAQETPPNPTISEIETTTPKSTKKIYKILIPAIILILVIIGIIIVIPKFINIGVSSKSPKLEISEI